MKLPIPSLDNHSQILREHTRQMGYRLIGKAPELDFMLVIR